MSDLELRDTPALAILRRLSAVGVNIDPAEISAAQNLLRVSKKLLGTFRDEFAKRGLSPGRYAALMVILANDGPMAPSEVADRLGVTRPTITGLVAGLVRDELVEYLAADYADRRRKEIALTDKGHTLLGSVVPDIFTLMAALLSPLSGDERTTLLHLLNRVESGLRRPPANANSEENDQ